MTRQRMPYVLLLAAVGCGASGGGEAMTGKADAGPGPRDGAGTRSETNPVTIRDTAAGVDGGGPPNVFADAPVFNWDVSACPGCAGTAGAGSGGSGGAGGSGGSGSGGTTANDGSPGSGGRTTDASSPSIDTLTAVDAGVKPDADGLHDSADAIEPDVSTPDGRPIDTAPACVARIVTVLPAVLPDTQNLVAAPNIKIVLRAEIVSGAPTTDATWTWQAKWNGAPLAVAERAPQDPAAAAFLIINEGDYFFTASAGHCMATFARSARGPGGCSACDYGTDVQIVSPPSYALSTQSGYFSYAQPIRLAESRLVKFFTSVGNSLVPSYVRINNPDGSLVTDGYVDPSVGFSRPLLVLSSNGDFASYQVLVVPMDGSGDGTVGATAPQLFTNLMEADLEQDANLRLFGGVEVHGTTLGASGQGLSDTRVMLSNQDPAAPATPANLIFSSVGHSDAQGSYTLHAQPGRYWVSFSPTKASGLSEAIDPSPISLTVDANLGFQWSSPSTAPLTLQVLDAAGNPAGDTRVFVNSTQSTPIGTLTIQVANAPALTHPANGNVQMEATADSQTGLVAFPALPSNAVYHVLLVPATLGPFAATTEITLTLPTEGLTQPVLLAAESSILGQLLADPVGSSAPEWSKVQVVAFDKSQVAPEPPRAVVANSDGSFVLGVTSGRPYAVMVWPDPTSALARTFVGPGLLQASVFKTTQKVQASMDWAATVSSRTNNQAVAIEGAALQATCHPGYWRCIDPTIPLAETASGDGGAFVLKVPNPATR